MAELQVGSTAPAIHLQTDTGEIFDLASARGKNVVLFFYPKADTPGCTTEACEFRDAYPKFGAETMVLGISADTPEKQAKFKEKFGFPLSAARRCRPQGFRGVRRVGREKHVRQEVLRDRAYDVPHR